jgi:hypothetical protein
MPLVPGRFVARVDRSCSEVLLTLLPVPVEHLPLALLYRG